MSTKAIQVKYKEFLISFLEGLGLRHEKDKDEADVFFSSEEWRQEYAPEYRHVFKMPKTSKRMSREILEDVLNRSILGSDKVDILLDEGDYEYSIDLIAVKCKWKQFVFSFLASTGWKQDVDSEGHVTFSRPVPLDPKQTYTIVIRSNCISKELLLSILKDERFIENDFEMYSEEE